MRLLPLVCVALLVPVSVRVAPAERAHGAVGARLHPGAIRFTATQVRALFSEMGFPDVADLHLDEQGIWRGRAEHAGRTLRGGLDYRGEIAAE